MGVPVVALRGDRHAARVSAGILHQAGLDSWVAATADEYVEIAVKAARDCRALGSLRQAMRERLSQSALLNTQARTREFEEFYCWAWQGWLHKAGACANASG
jgi:predicted O-linked N-acetylglucosamine transferase (SPINDLY family)